MGVYAAPCPILIHGHVCGTVPDPHPWALCGSVPDPHSLPFQAGAKGAKRAAPGAQRATAAAGAAEAYLSFDCEYLWPRPLASRGIPNLLCSEFLSQLLIMCWFSST